MTQQIEPLMDEREGLPSASNSYRRRNCMGSRAIVPLAPAQKDTAVALDGTDIHRALEKDNFSELDDDNRTIAETLDAMAEKMYDQWYLSLPDKVTFNEEVREYRETRLWFTNPSTGEKMESAKLDRFWICGPHALIIDYKSGFLMSIPSPKNYQLRVQALSLNQTFKTVTNIRVGICQFRFREFSDFADYSASDLHYSTQEIMLSDWQAQQPDAPRIPGEWCRYCPAKAICREAAVYALIPRSVIDTIGSGVTVEERVNSLPLEALAYIQGRANIVDKILEAVKDRMKSLTQDQRSGIGWTMTAGSEVDSVANAAKAFEILFTKKIISLEEFQAMCTVPIGRIEEICVSRLKDVDGIKTLKDAKPALRELLRPALKKSPRSGSLKQIAGAKELK